MLIPEDERFFDITLHLKDSCEENQKLVTNKLLDALYDSWKQTLTLLPIDSLQDRYDFWVKELDKKDADSLNEFNKSWKEYQDSLRILRHDQLTSSSTNTSTAETGDGTSQEGSPVTNTSTVDGGDGTSQDVSPVTNTSTVDGGDGTSQEGSPVTNTSTVDGGDGTSQEGSPVTNTSTVDGGDGTSQDVSPVTNTSTVDGGDGTSQEGSPVTNTSTVDGGDGTSQDVSPVTNTSTVDGGDGTSQDVSPVTNTSTVDGGDGTSQEGSSFKDLKDTWLNNQTCELVKTFKELIDEWKKDQGSSLPDSLEDLKESSDEIKNFVSAALLRDLYDTWVAKHDCKALLKELYNNWEQESSEDLIIKLDQGIKFRNSASIIENLNTEWKDYQKKSSDRLPDKLYDSWILNQDVLAFDVLEKKYEAWKTLEKDFKTFSEKERHELDNCLKEYQNSYECFEELLRIWEKCVKLLNRLYESDKRNSQLPTLDSEDDCQEYFDFLGQTMDISDLFTELKNDWERYLGLMPEIPLKDLVATWEEKRKNNLESASSFKKEYDAWVENELAKLTDKNPAKLQINEKLKKLSESWLQYQKCQSSALLGKLNDEWQKNQKKSKELNLEEVLKELKKNPSISVKNLYDSWVYTQNLVNSSLLNKLKDSFENNQSGSLATLLGNLMKNSVLIANAMIQALDESWKMFQECLQIVSIKNLRNTWDENQKIEARSSFRTQYNAFANRHMSNEEFKKLKKSWLLYQKCPTVNLFPSESLYKEWEEYLEASTKETFEKLCSSKTEYDKAKKSTQKNSIESEIGKLRDAWKENQNIVSSTSLKTLYSTWKNDKQNVPDDLPKDLYDFWLLTLTDDENSSFKVLNEEWMTKQRARNVGSILDLREAWEQYQKIVPDSDMNLENVLKKLKYDSSNSLEKLYNSWTNAQNLVDVDVLKSLRTKYNPEDGAEKVFKEVMTDEQNEEKITGLFNILQKNWLEYQDYSSTVATKDLRTTWEANQKIELAKSFTDKYDDWKLGNLNDDAKRKLETLKDSWLKYPKDLSNDDFQRLNSHWGNIQKSLINDSLRKLVAWMDEKTQNQLPDLLKTLFASWKETLEKNKDFSYNNLIKKWKEYKNGNVLLSDLKKAWEENQKLLSATSLKEVYDRWKETQTTVSPGSLIDFYDFWLLTLTDEEVDLFKKYNDSWKMSNKLNLGEVLEELKKNPSSSVKNLYESWVYTQNIEDVDFLEDLRTKYNEGNDKAEDVFKQVMTNDKYKNSKVSFHELDGNWLKCQDVSIKDLREAWEENQKIQLAKSFKGQYDDWAKNNKIVTEDKLKELSESWIEYQQKVPARLPKNQVSYGVLHAFIGHWKREFSKYFEETILKDDDALSQINYCDRRFPFKKEEDKKKKYEEQLSRVHGEANKLYEDLDALQYDKYDDLFYKEIEGLDKYEKNDHYFRELCEIKRFEKKIHEADYKELLRYRKDEITQIQKNLSVFLQLITTSENFVGAHASSDSFLTNYSLENIFGEKDARLICCFNKKKIKTRSQRFYSIPTFYILTQPPFTFVHPDVKEKSFIMHSNDMDRGLVLTIQENWSSFFPFLKDTINPDDMKKTLDELKKQLGIPSMKTKENAKKIMRRNENIQKAQNVLRLFIEKNVNGKNPTDVRRVGTTMKLSFTVDDTSDLVVFLKQYDRFNETHQLFLQTADIEKRE